MTQPLSAMNQEAPAALFGPLFRQSQPGVGSAGAAPRRVSRNPDGFPEHRPARHARNAAVRPGWNWCAKASTDVPPEQNLVWRAASALMSEVPSIDGAQDYPAQDRAPGVRAGRRQQQCRGHAVGAVPAVERGCRSSHLVQRLASALGSDVPFFLRRRDRARRGPWRRGLSRCRSCPQAHLVVIYPGLRVSTAEAYAMLTHRLTPDESHRRIYGFCSLLQAGLGLPVRGSSTISSA